MVWTTLCSIVPLCKLPLVFIFEERVPYNCRKARIKNGLNYPMPEDEVDEDTLGEFLSDFKKGKAKAFIKSKPVPKKQGNVIEVVGKTFNDIVMDESKVCEIL